MPISTRLKQLNKDDEGEQTWEVVAAKTMPAKVVFEIVRRTFVDEEPSDSDLEAYLTIVFEDGLETTIMLDTDHLGEAAEHFLNDVVKQVGEDDPNLHRLFEKCEDWYHPKGKL